MTRPYSDRVIMEWKGRFPNPLDRSEPTIDGDSLWLETDQGDWYRKVRWIRLHRVHAPEKKQTGWAECRDEMRRWLDRNNVGKWPFWVDTYRTSTDRDDETLGRIVADVYNADRSECLNLHMQAYVITNQYPGGS